MWQPATGCKPRTASSDCSEAVASVSMRWSGNHEFVSVDILGVTDPDDDAVTIPMDGIFQDEAVSAKAAATQRLMAEVLARRPRSYGRSVPEKAMAGCTTLALLQRVATAEFAQVR
jgi:hypothetical protein